MPFELNKTVVDECECIRVTVRVRSQTVPLPRASSIFDDVFIDCMYQPYFKDNWLFSHIIFRHVVLFNLLSPLDNYHNDNLI